MGLLFHANSYVLDCERCIYTCTCNCASHRSRYMIGGIFSRHAVKRPISGQDDSPFSCTVYLHCRSFAAPIHLSFLQALSVMELHLFLRSLCLDKPNCKCRACAGSKSSSVKWSLQITLVGDGPGQFPRVSCTFEAQIFRNASSGGNKYRLTPSIVVLL